MSAAATAPAGVTSSAMRRLAVIGVLLTILVVLGVAQLVLPGLAAKRIQERLSRSGQVESVQVRAFPAVELFWHHADRVMVRLRSFRSSVAQLASLLEEARGVGELDVSAGQVQAGLLVLRDATLRQRDGRLSGSARVVEGDLRRALPILQSVVPVQGPPGTLTLQGTATLFGLAATVDATLSAVDGALVLVPDVPFGNLARITAFSDPNLRVNSVSAEPEAGGFAVSGTATLH